VKHKNKDVKKRCSVERIIELLQQAAGGKRYACRKLSRKHTTSQVSLRMAQQIRWHKRPWRQALEKEVG